MVGKKTQVDYVFELDLKEEDNQPEEQKVKAEKANQKHNKTATSDNSPKQPNEVIPSTPKTIAKELA